LDHQTLSPKIINLTIVSFWSAWLAFFPSVLFYLSTEKERKRMQKKKKKKKEIEKKREALLCLRDLSSLSLSLSLFSL